MTDFAPDDPEKSIRRVHLSGRSGRSGGDGTVPAERLDAVAARRGVSAPRVALAWLLARSPNILLIPGTGSLAHLEENVAAGALRLTEEDITELG